MITCPKCSAQNDPSNRFCDQCGFRLEGVASNAPAAVADASAAPTPPAAATMNCPSCGAEVLPGEAFCDVCGASLQSVAANDAPTVLAAPTVDGSAMIEATMTSNDAPTADTPTVPPSSMEEATPTPMPAVAPPPPPPATDQQPPTPAVSAAPDQPAPTVQQADDQGGDAERQRLEEVIATQDRLIAQMEQMQAMFGPATPPAILDGLKQAHEAKDKAVADLQALPPPRPPVDPAEVARLEEVIATQDRLIAQMEQMQAMFGAATPPAILDGLKQAHETKDKAVADLQALTSGATMPPKLPQVTEVQPAVASQPAPASAPATESQPAQAAQQATPQTAQTPPVQAPVTPPPVQAPPPTRPRLVVVEGGRELPLPVDKAEIVIGREDPISQIFPEIDLTPFGGETGGVSRQHARISHTNGQWTLTDLNSTNYTRVDGVKIDPQVPVTIRDGARLQFGRIATVFHA